MYMTNTTISVVMAEDDIEHIRFAKDKMKSSNNQAC
jgi:hypothetical protein